jgi:FlaG/FlaF family flagellin (archaellin)
MRSKNILENDDAVSVSIGYILMFAITMLVFTAVILSFYTLSYNSEKSAMMESFRIVGSGVAAKITTVDLLVNITRSYDGNINLLEYDFSIPDSMASKSYFINITSSPQEIIIESDNGAKTVSPYILTTNITQRILYSGGENYMIKYNVSGFNIEIEDR